MVTNESHNYRNLGSKESGAIKGGNLWPFFDLQKLISEIMFGEDLFFRNIIKK